MDFSQPCFPEAVFPSFADMWTAADGCINSAQLLINKPPLFMSLVLSEG
jgi:hypothetical protein